MGEKDNKKEKKIIILFTSVTGFIGAHSLVEFANYLEKEKEFSSASSSASSASSSSSSSSSSCSSSSSSSGSSSSSSCSLSFALLIRAPNNEKAKERFLSSMKEK